MFGLTTVVFDVGGVLVDSDYRVLCRKLFDDEAEIDHFLADVLGPAFHEERDLGVPMAEIAARWSLVHPRYEREIHAFGDRFPEVWRGPMPGSFELLAELQAAGIGVFGLTNWGHETWALARQRFPLLDTFDGIVVSSEVGLTKPDPEIYELLCTRFGFTPDQAVFTDDHEPNVIAARALGFHSVTFTTADDLRADLIRCGLLH